MSLVYWSTPAVAGEAEDIAAGAVGGVVPAPRAGTESVQAGPQGHGLPGRIESARREVVRTLFDESTASASPFLVMRGIDGRNVMR